MRTIKEAITYADIIKEASALEDENIQWYPLYPNNNVNNRQEGIYTYIYHKDTDNMYSGRKYTIMFQRKLDERLCCTDEIEMYNLFEECFSELEQPPRVIESLSKEDEIQDCEDANNIGDFIRTFTTLDEAKKRALYQYKSIFVWALSFLA